MTPEDYGARRRPKVDYSEFQTRFPDLYPEGGPRCGFELPRGWRDVAWRLSEKLEPLGVVVDQVKEKLATLSVYLVEHTEEANRLINAAQEESSRVCQVCGAPGSIGKIGTWLWTLCHKCYEERRGTPI